MILIYIMSGFLVSMIIYHFLTRKYVNPYKLYMIFGAKGSGKTTYLTKLAIKYLKQNKIVYSTIQIPGTRLFNIEDLGKLKFEPYSVVLIDEIGLIYDPRKFKDFKPEVRDFFALQRHYKVIVYMFTQTYDNCDKKIRDLTDRFYILKPFMRVFSLGKLIYKDVDIAQTIDTETGSITGNQIIESYSYAPIFIPGARIFTFIPFYINFFDSYEIQKAFNMKYVELPIKEYLKPYLKKSTYFKRKIYNLKTSLETFESDFFDLPKKLVEKVGFARTFRISAKDCFFINS